MKTLLKDAETLREKLVQHRRYLHQNAETGFALPKTFAYVEKTLRDLGYTPQRCGRAGLIALVGEDNGAPCTLLRADMDGLPLRERSGEKFACKTGNMHACGHDLHAAMLYGAACLLKGYVGKTDGKVKFLFQAAEDNAQARTPPPEP